MIGGAELPDRSGTGSSTSAAADDPAHIRRVGASLVRQWHLAAISVVRQEALMASKDKGGRSAKKPAAKDLKAKRLEKKAKKAAHTGAANQSVDRTFGH